MGNGCSDNSDCWRQLICLRQGQVGLFFLFLRINNFLCGSFGKSLATSLSLLERELIESFILHLWSFKSCVLLSNTS